MIVNCVKKPEKKIQDFNGVWTRDLAIPVRCSTNWAKKPLTHFFHGNIWTHNWPAPNVSGFIAQLVEHRTGIARSRVQPRWSPEFFSRFPTQLHKLPSLRRSFLHFQISYLTPRNKLEILIKVPSTFPPTPPLTQQFAISEKLVPTFGYGRKFPKILNGSTNLAFVCVHTGTSSYAYRQFTWIPNITLIHEL